jgi:transcriptional regulator with PAS, ATPase and Fis domain
VELVESELFGHVRGAYTGSTEDRRGLFRYADGGSVLLDELSELDTATQTKLLRPLDDGRIKPVGADEFIDCDVRVLCASNRSLEEAVADGSFREDLFYRVAGIRIDLVPLRERREDVPLLAKRFLDRFTVEAGRAPRFFEETAVTCLVEHDWPGNVRQLLYLVRNLVDLSDSNFITADQVIAQLRMDDQRVPTEGQGLSERVREFERIQIIEALTAAHFNITAAARDLGIDRAQLHRKIKTYDIDPDSYRS